jgi:hypothetical protein
MLLVISNISCHIRSLNFNTTYCVLKDFGVYTLINDSVYNYRWRNGLLSGNVYGLYTNKRGNIFFDSKAETEFEKNSVTTTQNSNKYSSLKIFIDDSVEFVTFVDFVVDGIKVVKSTNEFGELVIPEGSESFHIHTSYPEQVNYTDLNYLIPSGLNMNYTVFLRGSDCLPDMPRFKNKYKVPKRLFKQCEK